MKLLNFWGPTPLIEVHGCAFKVKSEGAIRATVTRTPSASSLLCDKAHYFKSIATKQKIRYFNEKAVHNKVSTFEINFRKKALPLPPYVVTDSLSDLPAAKLITMDGKHASGSKHETVPPPPSRRKHGCLSSSEARHLLADRASAVANHGHWSNTYTVVLPYLRDAGVSKLNRTQMLQCVPCFPGNTSRWKSWSSTPDALDYPEPRFQGRGKREIPEKTRQPAASSGTIPTYENPGVTRRGIEPPFALAGRDQSNRSATAVSKAYSRGPVFESSFAILVSVFHGFRRLSSRMPEQRARTCESEVKKRGSDTGDTGHARLAPHRPNAQGVQCFRRGTVPCKSDLTVLPGEKIQPLQFCLFTSLPKSASEATAVVKLEASDSQNPPVIRWSPRNARARSRNSTMWSMFLTPIEILSFCHRHVTTRPRFSAIFTRDMFHRRNEPSHFGS
ncbi:hypothetical protein PR048_032328 [Dryococelus australis]|uniref:Uncharacterized protein n=1 Tax=Dryococelus australis TaxID=614101 RepID=A0ABQ9G1X7_9NEOP|nr:hypothetical protein PR048_032328 [Dryococelus australis]